MKTVYILGAGCSVEDDVPLVDNFFQIAFQKINGNLTRSQDKKFRAVRSFREEVLPGSNIEQLLGYIDLKLILHDNDSVIRRKFLILRRQLLYLIFKTIGENIIQGRSENYKNFLRNHLNYNLINDVTVISFNWELLLDNIIFEPLFRLENLCVDYGTDFEMIKEDGLLISAYRGSSYKLLKLHGSMNWMCCWKCHKRFFAFADKIIIPFFEKRTFKCPNCGGHLYPLIVPPTFQKFKRRFEFNFLRDIWLEANKALTEARKIIIVGYSFPEDDVHFKHFLQGAVAENYKNNREPIEVEVINYKPYLQQRSDFERHYMDILEIPTVKINPSFYYMKFSEFSKLVPSN